MKKTALGLAVSMIFLPAASFAQSTQAPAAWVAFMKEENVKRAAFNKQINADRIAFLNANPSVQAYLDQIKASSKARMAAWKAAHPFIKKTH